MGAGASLSLDPGHDHTRGLTSPPTRKPRVCLTDSLVGSFESRGPCKKKSAPPRTGDVCPSVGAESFEQLYRANLDLTKKKKIFLPFVFFLFWGGSESLCGLAWFGSVWGGILGGIARVARGIFPPRELFTGSPLNSRAELESTVPCSVHH